MPAAQAQDSPDLAALMDEITALGPRHEGSAAEGRALALIRRTALRLGYETVTDDLSGLRHSHSFSSSLTCRKEGRLDDTLVIALSLDSGARVGETEAGRDESLALALYLMEDASAWTESGISLEFAFLGAQIPPLPGLDDYPLGSSSLIAGFPEGRRTTVLSLGPLLPGAPVLMRSHGSGIVAPLWFFRRVLKGLSAAGLETRHFAFLNQLFRTELAGDEGASRIFLENSIPAVELRSEASFSASPEEAEAWASAMAAFLLDLAGPEALPFEDSWDRHYLVLGEGEDIVVLQEGRFLILMLSVLLGFILFFAVSSILMRESFIAFMKGVSRSFLSLIFAFILCFALIWGSSLIFSAWTRFNASPSSWSAYAPSLVAAKLLILAGLVGIVIPLALRFRLIPSTLAFYGGSALALLFLDILLFFAMDISYAIFFAWAFIFCVLAILLKSAPLAAVFFGLTFTPLAWFGLKAAPVGGERLARILFLPGPLSSIILAFIILPALLLLVRILMLIRGREADKGGMRTRIALILGSLTFIAGIATLTASDPFRGGAIPITLHAAVDQKEGILELRVESGKKRGRVRLSCLGSEFELPLSGASARFPAPPGLGYALSREVSSFLSRKSVFLRFEGAATESLQLTVSGREGQAIYDCSFPFTTDPESGLTDIHLGSHPPLPLLMEMTMDGEFSGELVLESRSLMDVVSLEPGYRLERAIQSLRQTFPLE